MIRRSRIHLSQPSTTKITMQLVSDFDILLNTFVVIGIPFYGDTRKETKDLKSVVKLGCKVLLELLFTSFGTYIVLNCTLGFPKRNLLFKLTTSAMSIVIMSLRLYVSINRTYFLRLILELQRFVLVHQTQPYATKKTELFRTCIFSIAFPLVISLICMLIMFQNYEDIRHILKPNVLSRMENPIIILLTLLLISASYTLHFFVVPTLCMMLFHFVFAAYTDALKHVTVEIRQNLEEKSSVENIEKGLAAIAGASKVHQVIEDVLSPAVFLEYILVFINFLNLVTLNVTTFEDTTGGLVRTVGCLLVFAWTTACFVRLTLMGSELQEVCNAWTLLRRDAVKSCLVNGNADEAMALLLFGTASKLELYFSGWGMFQLDRSLLLSMVGVIVSYGVLIVTT